MPPNMEASGSYAHAMSDPEEEKEEQYEDERQYKGEVKGVKVASKGRTAEGLKEGREEKQGATEGTTMCRTDTWHGGSGLMVDPACATPKEGAEPGEQPRERLKIARDGDGSTSSRRGRGGEMGKEKGRETDQTMQ